MNRITKIRDYNFPDDISPVDFLLRLVNRKKTIEAEDNVKLFADDSKNFDYLRSYRKTGQDRAIDLEPETDPILRKVSIRRAYRQKKDSVGAFYKGWLLFGRGVKNLLNDKKLFFVFNFQMFSIMAIIIGVYYNITRDYDDLVNLQNRIGSFFFIATNYYCCLLLNSSFSMVSEAQIIYKEISADQYGFGAYFWSKSAVDLLVYLPPIFIQLYIVLSSNLVLLLSKNGGKLDDVSYLLRILSLECDDWKFFRTSHGNFCKNSSDHHPGDSCLLCTFRAHGRVHHQHRYNIMITGELEFFEFMKYLSPMKFSLEVVLTQELKGSPFGEISLELYDYKFGLANCRYVMLAYFLLARISSYLAFVHQTKLFI